MDKTNTDADIYIVENQRTCDRYTAMTDSKNAILLCETWRPPKAEIWESHCGHVYRREGGFDDKHDVGIVPDKKKEKKILRTEYVSERMITTVLKLNLRKVVLTSVYFAHTGYADNHVEKMYKCIESHTKCRRNNTTIVAGDSNAQLGPGPGPNESSKHGDRLKRWLMMQNYVALNTMFKKRPETQTTFRAISGIDKTIGQRLG